jgi:hypothetical protein
MGREQHNADLLRDRSAGLEPLAGIDAANTPYNACGVMRRGDATPRGTRAYTANHPHGGKGQTCNFLSHLLSSEKGRAETVCLVVRP